MKRNFSRILSVILTVCMLAGVCSCLAYAQNDELKITVTTDTHFQCSSDLEAVDSSLIDSAYGEGMVAADMYFHATFQGQMNHESEAICRKMLDEFASSDSEYLLIGGDLTCGKRQSHIEFAQLLKETEEKSGKKIFVICGNHDCDDDNFDKYIDINEFKEIYYNFGFCDAIANDPASASYAADLSDGYRLIAVDSCIYGADDGQIKTDTLEWIKAQTAEANADGKKVIAMMHHSLLPHFGVQPMIDNYSAIAGEFAALGIKLVFTGHIHANDISMAKDGSGNTVYDVQTGSLITAPCAYREVTLTDSHIDIVSKRVEEIDTSYLPGGFTEAQLELISNDFPAYAEGYFESGICRWLNRYIGSAGKVGKLLKFDPDTLGYKLVDSIMLNIGEALNLPIYDDGSTPGVIDSIEEIAAVSGAQLPDSDYERLYQLAARVMGSFYHGDEPASLETVEFPLFYACVKAVLARTGANLAFGNGISFIYKPIVEGKTGSDPYTDLLSDIAELNFSTGIFDIVLKSTLGTLLDGLISDYSEPSDINVTIPGYGMTDNAGSAAMFNIIIRMFEILKRFFSFFFAK